jgi:hypothetical protein
MSNTICLKPHPLNRTFVGGPAHGKPVPPWASDSRGVFIVADRLHHYRRLLFTGDGLNGPVYCELFVHPSIPDDQAWQSSLEPNRD